MSSVRNDFLMTSVSTIVACVGAFSAVLSSTTLVCVMVFLFIVPIIISLVDADAHILTALSPPLACVLQHQSCNLPAKPLSAASSSTTHALLSFLGVVLLVRAVRSPVDKRNAQLTRTVFIALSGGLFLSSASRLVDRHGADVRSAVSKALPSNLAETTEATFSWVEGKLSSVTQDVIRMMGLDISPSAAPKPSSMPSRRSKIETAVELDADVGEDVPLVDAEDDEASHKQSVVPTSAPAVEATPAPEVVSEPEVEPTPVAVPTPESAPVAVPEPTPFEPIATTEADGVLDASSPDVSFETTAAADELASDAAPTQDTEL